MFVKLKDDPDPSLLSADAGPMWSDFGCWLGNEALCGTVIGMPIYLRHSKASVAIVHSQINPMSGALDGSSGLDSQLGWIILGLLLNNVFRIKSSPTPVEI